MYKRVGNHVYIYHKFLKFLSSVAQSLTKITQLVAKKNGRDIASELHQITPDAFPPNCTETSQLRNICHPHLRYFFGGHFLPNDLHQDSQNKSGTSFSGKKKHRDRNTTRYIHLPLPWPCATLQHARMVRALEASSRPPKKFRFVKRRDTSKL